MIYLNKWKKKNESCNVGIKAFFSILFFKTIQIKENNRCINYVVDYVGIKAREMLRLKNLTLKQIKFALDFEAIKQEEENLFRLNIYKNIST